MKQPKILLIFLMLFTTALLSACLYPEDEKASLETPYQDQLDIVQQAVDAYQDATGGLLPIKTKDSDTDLYIKYPIDFSKIVPAYTEKIPANAYEVGGIFQYVLIDVEKNPTVKLVDLRQAERIRELNISKQVHGQVFFKESIGEGVFEVDFAKMGFDKPVQVQSPYSDTLLPIVVGGDGHFYVDYSIDLGRILEEKQPDVKQGEDIRYLLEESSPILPAYSLPYTVNEQNEVRFMAKHSKK